MKYTKAYVTITARNVLFSKRTEDFLEGLQYRAANFNVKKYIKSNLRNWLINSYEDVDLVKKARSSDPNWLKTALERGDEVYRLNLSLRSMQTISHWLDYLNTLEGDISRISIPQLEDKVKEWDKSFAKQKANEEDGIELVHEYPDGFSWVKVFGESSLDREGRLMNHCAGSYYKEVKNGRVNIYSLRDKNNKPHCTIELSRNEIQQIKGNSNEAVKDKYKKYVIDFLEKKYVKFDSINSADLIDNGWIKIGDTIYDLNSLPKGLHVKGNLNLCGSKIITSLPEDLKVNGNLDISFSSIDSLPKGLKVGGDLDLSFTKVESIPNDVEVGGDVHLDGFIALTKIGKNVKIGGDLRCSSISELSEGLKVGGNLNLSYSKIKSLPEDIKVGADLLLGGTQIAKLPNSLRKISSTLDLSDTKIKSLPDGLEVGGDLDLIGCKITKLPKGLKVGGNLYIRNTKIRKLPEDLKVGGHIVDR